MIFESSCYLILKKCSLTDKFQADSIRANMTISDISLNVSSRLQIAIILNKNRVKETFIRIILLPL